jgi:hypothetical protein
MSFFNSAAHFLWRSSAWKHGGIPARTKINIEFGLQRESAKSKHRELLL